MPIDREAATCAAVAYLTALIPAGERPPPAADRIPCARCGNPYHSRPAPAPWLQRRPEDG